MSFLIKDTSFNKCWRESYPMQMANTRALHSFSALLSFCSVVVPFLRNLLAVNAEVSYLVSLTCMVETVLYVVFCKTAAHPLGFFLPLCQKLRLFTS